MYPNNLPAFRALRTRTFRNLWLGLIVSAAGTWMQIVAQSLLVLKITHNSAFALGCVSLSQAAAFLLFALVGGGFADRLNRKRLLIATQSSLMLLAATLGALAYFGLANVFIIAAFAFLSGCLLSFDQPARAALISSLVPPDDLLNAVSLQSAVFNAASVAGPVLAGLAAGFLGLTANFFINALSFIPVLAALAALPKATAPVAARQKLINQVRGVLGTVRSDSHLFALLQVYGVLLFAGPSLPLLLPVLAVDRLHIGPVALGVLFSAAGLGAIIGALLLTGLSQTGRRLAPLSIAIWCAALTLTATATSVPAAYGWLLLLGASQSIVGAIFSASLQTTVPSPQRGRAMSLNTLLIMGIRPLGDFPAASAIGMFGATYTAIASAALVATAALLGFAKRR